MTQEDLAEAAKVHFTYISFIESGQRNFTLTTLWKISDALGVTAAELMERADGIARKDPGP